MGKSGVMIQINGHTIQSTGSQLFSTLEAMPSDNISKIEIISNPSSKYENEASSILNIILKKPINQGLNIEIKSFNGYGKYLKVNEGINLNYNSSKITIYAITNIGKTKGTSNNDINIETNTSNTEYNSAKFTYKDDNSLYARCGLDYYIDSIRSLGIIYTNNSANQSWKGNSTISNISKAMDSTLIAKTLLTKSFGPKTDNTINLYYSPKLKKNKGDIEANLAWYSFSQNKNYNNLMTDDLSNVNMSYSNTLKMNMNIFDFKLDIKRI